MKFASILMGALVAVTVVAARANAADDNVDGLDDSIDSGPRSAINMGSNIAVVETDSQEQVTYFVNRLATYGVSPALIEMTSDLSVLSQYDMVLLPVSHAHNPTYAIFNSLAEDYKAYVLGGGCLYVGQPNPTQQPRVITWLPYHLELHASGDFECPTSIVAPLECSAVGLAPEDLPSAADRVLSMGPEWTVVAMEPTTLEPSLLVASYGAGNINVDLASPSPDAACPYTDLGFARMVDCCLGVPPVPVEETSWGRVKSTYR